MNTSPGAPPLDEGFLLALEASPTGMVVVGPDGCILYANAELESLLGYGRGEMADLTVEDLIPRPIRERHAHYRAEYHRDPAHKQPSGRHLSALHHDGTKVPVEVGLNPFDHGGLRCVLCSVVDIRARLELEQQRHDRELAALEAQRLGSLGVLASGVAHDFNNLLVSVLGNARLAQTAVSQGMVAECLEDIALAAEQASQLSRQLMLYATRNAGRSTCQDLSGLVRDSSRLLQVLVRHRASVTVEASVGLPRIRAAANELRQVLLNLVGNAADAMSDDGGHVIVRTGCVQVPAGELPHTIPATLPPGTYATLEVIDDACGIPEAIRDHLFEPFVSTKEQGHGLGLAATLGIVRAHHGAIQVETSPKGTTMRVLLPSCEDDQACVFDPNEPRASCC